MLDTQSGINLTFGTITTGTMSSFVFSNSSPFRYYRFAITASTCVLALSGLVTIRDNDDDLYDAEAVAFADYLIQIILAQPDTVLAMEASELDEIGQTLIHNCEAWLS